MSRILIVDDMPSIRFLIRTNLELAGHEVSEAIDGQDCLDLLDSAPALPHAVTLDMMMPRMDGVTAAERIRRNPVTSEIAIIMVTTQGQQADVSRATAAGVDAYITKPFDPEELVATVEAAIAARQ